ncbi:MAG: hypothetical protein ACWA5R_12315 [bacterium]
MSNLFQRFALMSLVLLVACMLPALAEVPQPNIPEPDNAESCVHPEADMRKNHMEYILHQRTETVHKGIRTKKDSLVQCINCHGVKDGKGGYVGIESEKHFCRACHDYAAVNIDCFQCHADKPESEYNKAEQSVLDYDLIHKTREENEK